jgi:hypothetical protein
VIRQFLEISIRRYVEYIYKYNKISWNKDKIIECWSKYWPILLYSLHPTVGRDAGAARGSASRTTGTKVFCFLVRPGLLPDRRSAWPRRAAEKRQRPSCIHQRTQTCTKGTKLSGSFSAPGRSSFSPIFSLRSDAGLPDTSDRWDEHVLLPQCDSVFRAVLPLVFVSFRVRSVLLDRGVAQASRLGGDWQKRASTRRRPASRGRRPRCVLPPLPVGLPLSPASHRHVLAVRLDFCSENFRQINCAEFYYHLRWIGQPLSVLFCFRSRVQVRHCEFTRIFYSKQGARCQKELLQSKAPNLVVPPSVTLIGARITGSRRSSVSFSMVVTYHLTKLTLK